MITGYAQSGVLVTGSEARAVSCQAQFQGDSVYTVQFGILNPTINTIIRPQADIILSVNGNDIRRRISVVNGTSISGVSAVAKVRLRDALIAAMPGVLGIEYQGTIQISKGVRPASSLQPYLVPDEYIDSFGVTQPYVSTVPVPAANSAFVLIPQNAGITSVMVTVESPPIIIPVLPITVKVSQLSPGFNLAVYDPRNYDFVPLQPGAIRIGLFNPTVANDVLFSVLFGVDG